MIKIKTFREQFNECRENKTCILCTPNNKEVVEIRPNIYGLKEIKITSVFFCNKYMKRCSSSVCKKERENIRRLPV